MINNIIEQTINILNSMNFNDINIDNIETDFILENNIDSITFIEIIIILEEEFSILVPEEYLLMENLNTVSKITNLIKELVDQE